jgi:hypothetical protein
MAVWRNSLRVMVLNRTEAMIAVEMLFTVIFILLYFLLFIVSLTHYTIAHSATVSNGNFVAIDGEAGKVSIFRAIVMDFL